MATLTNQIVNRAGILPTYAAATGGGDAMVCSNDSMLHIKNGGGGSITVTLAVPSTTSAWPNASYGNVTVTVPNGSERMIGPVTPGLFQDPVTALCTITYSGVTSVTVASLDFQQP